MNVELDDPVESLYLDGYLGSILSRKPMLRREWEVEDFRQELSLSYLRKISEDRRDSMSGDHRRSLVKRMAEQLSNDKLREMQRGKRDCRRLSRNSCADHPDADGGALDNLCDQESWDLLRRRMSGENWQIFCLRGRGLSWDEIAARVGRDTPNSLRMRYCRSIRRMATLFKEATGVCDDRAPRGFV